MRAFTIGLTAVTLLAAPALAQTQPNSGVGGTLNNLNRALNPQSQQPAYDDQSRSYSGSSQNSSRRWSTTADRQREERRLNDLQRQINDAQRQLNEERRDFENSQ